MRQAEVRIRDAQSAVNAYVTMTRFGLPTTLPTDAGELARQLKRVTGRSRDLATALNVFVETKGFDALANAVKQDGAKRGLMIALPHRNSEAADDDVIISEPGLQSDALSSIGRDENSGRSDAEAASTPSSPSFAVLELSADPMFAWAASGLY